MLCDVGVGREAVIELSEIVVETSTKSKTTDGSNSTDSTGKQEPEIDEEKKQVFIHSFIHSFIHKHIHSFIIRVFVH